mmetsp:Transcript_7454/g.15882  ORF Transcript_7454/g.15882 Transcript_7454/m.15882 type:complete len:172 (-) Transcript_7454:21-536(-)
MWSVYVGVCLSRASGGSVQDSSTSRNRTKDFLDWCVCSVILQGSIPEMRVQAKAHPNNQHGLYKDYFVWRRVWLGTHCKLLGVPSCSLTSSESQTLLLHAGRMRHWQESEHQREQYTRRLCKAKEARAQALLSAGAAYIARNDEMCEEVVDEKHANTTLPATNSQKNCTRH